MKSSYNDSVWSIWNKHTEFVTELNRAPLVYRELQRGGLLCLGMNPSFSGGEALLNTENPLFSGMTRNEFYSIDVAKRFESQWLYEEFSQQDHSFESHPYHKLFRHIKEEIAAPRGVNFQHVDLFPVRETSQKVMMAMIKAKAKAKSTHLNFNEFGAEMFKAFLGLLEAIAPDYLMANNAQASHLLLAHFGVSVKEGLDTKYGCYFLNIAGKKTPLLCSGMLSGQRALDIYSRERLFWQLGNLLTKL